MDMMASRPVSYFSADNKPDSCNLLNSTSCLSQWDLFLIAFAGLLFI